MLSTRTYSSIVCESLAMFLKPFLVQKYLILGFAHDFSLFFLFTRFLSNGNVTPIIAYNLHIFDISNYQLIKTCRLIPLIIIS